VAFAGNFVPAGWEEAAGQLLPLISQNFALFSLLGTQYGGNGTTNCPPRLA
jgi:microcystin-dependent protein